MPLANTPLFRDALAALEWEVHPLGRPQWLSLARSPYLAFKDDSELIPALIQAQFMSGSHEISLENALHIAARLDPSSSVAAILHSIRSSRTGKGVKNLNDWTEVIRERLALWGGRAGPVWIRLNTNSSSVLMRASMRLPRWQGCCRISPMNPPSLSGGTVSPRLFSSRRPPMTASRYWAPWKP